CGQCSRGTAAKENRFDIRERSRHLGNRQFHFTSKRFNIFINWLIFKKYFIKIAVVTNLMTKRNVNIYTSSHLNHFLILVVLLYCSLSPLKYKYGPSEKEQQKKLC